MIPILLRLLFFALSSFFLFESGIGLAQNNTYKVVYVTDGDSLLVQDKNQKIKVRMIGIDAPESFANEKAARDSKRSGIDVNTIVNMGKQSAKYLRQILAVGTKIKLISDVSKFDKYGRILAYVYDEKDQFINLRMIEDGYAYPYSVPPNLKYEKDFRKAAQKARAEKVGLWR